MAVTEIEFVCHRCGAVNSASLEGYEKPVASGEATDGRIVFVQCRITKDCEAWNRVELTNDK